MSSPATISHSPSYTDSNFEEGAAPPSPPVYSNTNSIIDQNSPIRGLLAAQLGNLHNSIPLPASGGEATAAPETAASPASAGVIVLINCPPAAVMSLRDSRVCNNWGGLTIDLNHVHPYITIKLTTQTLSCHAHDTNERTRHQPNHTNQIP